MENSILNKLVDKYTDKMITKKNVVAIGVGEKWSNGKPTGQSAILVFVSQKESGQSLSKTDLIPKYLGNTITDVVGKTGTFSTHALTKRVRPLISGYSCGHKKVTAGTMGGFFKRARQKDTVMLSNNHVLANENNAKIGDAIVQPGRYDGGTETVAKLAKFVPIKSTGNTQDSAIAKPIKRANFDIPKIGRIKGFNLVPRIGMVVEKTGRTTGHTRGRIIGTHASVRVAYDSGVKIFRDQIITTFMSRGGDSGSLLIEARTNKVVGLLFAGSSRMTIHNNIKYPLATYGLQLGIKPKPKRRRRRIVRRRPKVSRRNRRRRRIIKRRRRRR